MTLENANPPRCEAHPAEETNETAQSDAALIKGLLARDEAAWRTFFLRFDPVLRRTVQRTLRGALHTMLASDAIDDVLGDLYVELVERDMHHLRVWAVSAQQASLQSWLKMLVAGVAIEHYRREALLLTLPMRAHAETETEDERASCWAAAQASLIESEKEKEEPQRKQRRGVFARSAAPINAPPSYNKRTARLAAIDEKLKLKKTQPHAAHKTS